MQQDEEQLRLLSIFHYVTGGIVALTACFPVCHLVMGIILIVASAHPEASANADAPPAFIGWVFVGMASVIMIAGWSAAACILVTGRFLSRRKHYMFCLVMAGIECVFMPIGTVLGGFTIIVLVRERVKKMFSSDEVVGVAS